MSLFPKKVECSFKTIFTDGFGQYPSVLHFRSIERQTSVYSSYGSTHSKLTLRMQIKLFILSYSESMNKL